MAEVVRINGILSSGRSPSRIDIDKLMEIRGKYPNAADVRVLLQNSFIKREDWAAAEKVILQTPDPQRTNYDRINLGQIYLKQGKSAQAIDVLKAISPSDSERVKVTALLGQAQFMSGDLAASKATLEAVRDELVKQRRADDLATLGTIYLRSGDAVKAIDILKTAIDADANSVSAYNMIVRAYSSVGDTARASEYAEKLRSINARVAEEEKKKSRLVPLFYALEDAYASKDFDKVIALARQIEPESDDRTRPTLYQYMAAAYKAQGKEAEAAKAMAEAQRSSPK